MTLAWTDAEAIARALLERFPDKDPLTIRFPDLERWVVEVPGFTGTTAAATPRLLEAIQERWYRLYDRS